MMQTGGRDGGQRYVMGTLAWGGIWQEGVIRRREEREAIRGIRWSL
jgi:hypothetical protein